MDITNEYWEEQWLNQVRSNSPRHWKSRNARKQLDLIISGYRMTAYKYRGSYVGQYCSQQANWIEKRLNLALGNNGVI